MLFSSFSLRMSPLEEDAISIKKRKIILETDPHSGVTCFNLLLPENKDKQDGLGIKVGVIITQRFFSLFL